MTETMRLDEITPLLTTVTTPHLAATLSTWHVGQVLDAVVTRITNVGTATLNINNISLEIHSDLPLAVGGPLVLEVAEIGARIALRILTPPASKDAIGEALRMVAPRQGELAPVLTELARVASTSVAPGQNVNIAPAPLATATLPASLATALATAPPELRELAKNIIERLRTPAQAATPEGLRQALKNSGPFLEHQLAIATGSADAALVLSSDLKAGLLQLVSYLKAMLPQSAPASVLVTPLPSSPVGTAHGPTLPRASLIAAQLIDQAAPLEMLAKDIEGALARITTQQLLSLPERASDAPQWIFDLPLRNGARVDVFHLHVFREKHRRDSQQPPAWCVRLSFELATLGKVGVLVTLFAGSVSVAIWARHSATASWFEHHLQKLRTELHDAGVALSHLHCECGEAPFSTDPPLKRNLLDERA